jgi:hypothetical protein
MRLPQSAGALGLTVILIGSSASAARAQQIELGAPLFNGTVGLSEDSVSAVGVPSGSFFGLFSPGVYVSIFAWPRVAIEPQLGLVTLYADGETAHFLTTGAQVNYLFGDRSQKTPYVFGGVGLVSVTDLDYTPVSLTAGAGYRMPLGGRLVFRFDGRYTHYTGEFDDGLHTVSFTLSIGGLFR